MNINYTKFLDKLNSDILALGIDISDAKLDHLGFQTSSSLDYEKLKEEILEESKLVREAIVGGRRVGIFKLHKLLEYKDEMINVLELIEPKPDQNPPSALEHAEYLLPVSLEDFMESYPDVSWDTRAINREEFPMLILKITDSTTVKFPRFSVLK